MNPGDLISCSTKNVLWQEVDEGWVGYCERAGTTFLIDPLSRFIFDVLCESDALLSLAQLAYLLEQAVPDMSSPAQDIDSALEILKSTGLIEIGCRET